MTNKMLCKKVISLLSLYIENKLDVEDKLFVENHFITCSDCYQKYLEMKEIMNNLHLEYQKLLNEFERIESNKMFNIREYETFIKIFLHILMMNFVMMKVLNLENIF